jgi:methyl-accepting chemotaxis protein
MSKSEVGMHERRKTHLLQQIKFTLKFFYLSLTYVLLLMIMNFYATWSIIKELESAFQDNTNWQTDFIVAQVCLIVSIVILLTTIMMIVHRSMGPVPRMEAALESVLKGDYSQRINIRRKDFMHDFVGKLNKVLELLEQKVKT